MDLKIDTSNMSMKERIQKLIEYSTKKRFESSRQELVEQGEQYKYHITEIKRIGRAYNYKASSKSGNVEVDYTCFPERGEYTMYMVGDKEVVQSFYNQLKVQQDWDKCQKVNEGERCESDKHIEKYPVQTHFKVSIWYNNNIATLNFNRLLTPIE